MAKHLVVYSLIHQPRRVRLPARPIEAGASPADMAELLFDPELDKHYLDVIGKWCYHPAAQAWSDMLDDGMKLGIGFSLSVLRQFEKWDPPLLARFQKLVAKPGAELIGVTPYHGTSLLFSLSDFIDLMRLAGDGLHAHFGVRPTVTDTTEMMMSSDIYRAIHEAGFSGAFMDGRPWVMQWRSAAHLYHAGLPVKLLTRHFDLSNDVGYRFSNHSWDGWPLLADEYARWIDETPGDLVTLAWDLETFGHHHNHGTGIFEFLRALPAALRKRGITSLLPSEAIEYFGPRSHQIPLPPFPVTWAGASGSMDFFLGNRQQQAVFRLMITALNKARLTGDEDLVDIALWLSQSDNLHWLQAINATGSEAEVSAYFTPVSWRHLGLDQMVWEHQCVYKNSINALDDYR